MWIFKGEYFGEAKEYIQQKQKKESVTLSLVFSIVIALIFIGTAIVLGDGDITLILIILGAGIGLIALSPVVFSAKRLPKNTIEIENDGFYISDDVNGSYSFVFYKIKRIDDYDGFIVVSPMGGRDVVLQKELLVEGAWEELKVLLKKVEDSLESDDPMYQIEDPATEFFTATVKEKRIYEKFVNGVSAVTPVGLFEYFATFALEDNTEVEYQIGPEWYEKIEKEQTGTLVLVNGNFFSFGDGEDVS